MEHFVIYTNLHKDNNMAVTNRIREYLEGHGKYCVVRVKEMREKPDDFVLPEETDCMIVLGGDGTMLQAAWDVKKRNIPLIGVNMGTLGYMTEIELSCLEESLDRLMEGHFSIENRMMLHGSVLCGDQKIEDWALNDIVISRSGSLQIIKFNIFVNGQFLNNYNADGVIITTPTGSTGYNLSAGGPIVEPKAKLIIITPICPHALNQRSIILSPEDVIEIEIPEGREGHDQLVEVNFDGSHVIPVKTGDRIRIMRSVKTTDFILMNQVSFLEVLHKKMSES
ncbi:MAG: NAD(+)/NADH kinase [Lachnospiraceae bacterium]|nr:NAD(+)/NADH kinase [Lachnospiraceae bacterium]